MLSSMDSPMKIDFPTTLFDTEPVPQVTPSHMSQLPADLLLLIFQTTVFAVDTSPLVPFILSQVCARWRDFALRTPTLWTDIVVYCQQDNSASYLNNTLHRIRVFLELSCTCPLSVQFTFESCRWPPHDVPQNIHSANLTAFFERIDIISSTVGQHAHRIKRFSLSVNDFDLTGTVLGALGPVQMPLLETWTVHNTYDVDDILDDAPEESEEDEDEDEVDAHSLLLRNHDMSDEEAAMLYPNLQVLTLHSTPLRWPRFCPRNLVRLDIKMPPRITRLSSADLLPVLTANAHSLERLCLHAALLGDEWPQTCAMPKLYHLDLGFVYALEYMSFIQAIQVPKLNELAICDIRRQNMRLSDFDTSIVELVKVIINQLPLHQIWQLKLHHIAFCPQLPGYRSEMHGELAIYQTARKFVGHFFSRLTALRYLVLCGADYVSLAALNYIIPCSSEKHGTAQPRVPAPQLTLLHVVDSPYSVLDNFVASRLANPALFATLFGFVVSMPRSWYERVERSTTDLSPLANNISLFISNLHPAVEKALHET